MTKALNVRHLRAHFGSFAVFLHLLGGEINHEEDEEHGEFRVVVPLCRANAAGEVASFRDHAAYYY
jgi:hypothetical protein